ncbi:MAG: hypothetical protein KAW88_05490 [Candidatus Cloacimonetes bacterium]|nr:hypothetical protein [Candidatus Cloacimonadota bacterium]
MKRKCTVCSAITKDDRLVACPECGADLASGEPDRTLLTHQQEKYIVSKIWTRLLKFVLGGFSVLTIISIIFLIPNLITAYKSGIAYLEKTLVDRVSKEFEDPRIRDTVNEVAAELAGEMMQKQIEPEIAQVKQELQEQLANVQSAVDKIEQMAAPPSLSLYTTTISNNAGVYTAVMSFEPSKTMPLGPVVFVAEIQNDSQSKILDFWPKGGAFLSGDQSKKIEADGRMARLQYQLIGFAYPQIELKLSAPAQVKIHGNHELESFILEVK